MSKRKYPYISGRCKLKPQHIEQQKPVCKTCGAPALYRCEIQVSWFRGDDESELRCEAHSKAECAAAQMAERATAGTDDQSGPPTPAPPAPIDPESQLYRSLLKSGASSNSKEAT